MAGKQRKIMKTFNKIVIQPVFTTPKVNQIFESEQYGHLIKIVKVCSDFAVVQSEDGSKSQIGFAWFDGLSYKLIGTV